MYYVNTKEYWDSRFETNWLEFNGDKQTNEFMELTLEYLPENILLDNKKILDWGCAFGQGVDLLSKKHLSSEVSGLDISEIAIRKCLDLYPMNDFFCGKLSDFNHTYDVIFISNCLQLFNNPIRKLKEIAKHSSELLIILVPFKDENFKNPEAEVKFYFEEHSFPDVFEGFKKEFQKVISTGGNYWVGDQLLVVYKK